MTAITARSAAALTIRCDWRRDMPLVIPLHCHSFKRFAVFFVPILGEKALSFGLNRLFHSRASEQLFCTENSCFRSAILLEWIHPKAGCFSFFMARIAARNKEKKGVKKAAAQNGSGHHYDASSITVLEGLEPVRKRPGMYIGTTGPDGLHHLITEIFDNSRDEAMGGFANDIEVILLPENRVRVVDNGRGIPVDTHKQTKASALETIMTTLHAGAKFGGEGYKISGGLHGVGGSVVNALSVYCKAEVHRDGGVYVQEYSRGKRKSAVKKVGNSKLHGTIVTFQPDPDIFPDTSFNFDKIVNHLRQQAYLVKGLRISILDARNLTKIDDTKTFYIRHLSLDIPSMSFYFEGGLMSLVRFENQHNKPIHKNIFYIEKKANGNDHEIVEVALQYVDDISCRLLPFANNIYTAEGGTHDTGFKTALTRSLNSYARKN